MVIKEPFQLCIIPIQNYSLSYGRKVHNDRQLVTDSVQELFVYLWTRREHLGDTASVRFYLIKALRTIILKEIIRNKTIDLNHSEYKISEQITPEDEIISREQTIERKELIRRVLNNLSSREREVLYFKYFTGLSNDEIANLLEIKYQSVKNVAFRALKKLKKQFRDGPSILEIT